MDLDWARVWQDQDTDPQLEEIDFVMRKASRYELGMLVSITNPPSWAVTAKGPDQAATIRLVLLLAERYHQNYLFIELFPGANTIQGWGVEPDPVAYKTLLKSTGNALKSSGSPVLLVAGGLIPVSADRSAGDMDDLEFLSGLYRAGSEDFMPVVSLRLPAIQVDILADPQDESAAVLRHYEAIRNIMTKYSHNSGLIWITGYSCPVNELHDDVEQLSWISQSYQLMRSQLYLGAAFLDGLNSPMENFDPHHLYLIHKDGTQTSLHPALTTIGQSITLDRTGQTIPNPLTGKSTTSGIIKWIMNP